MIKKLVILSCAVAVSLFAADDFFALPKDAEVHLPPQGVYPNGQQLLFSGYSPMKRDLRRLKDGGFNTLGPVYNRAFDEYLKLAQNNGLCYIYQVSPVPPDRKEKPYTRDELSKADLNYVKQWVFDLVNKYKENESIAMWSVAPDELRYWYPNEMEYLRVVCDAIHEADFVMKRPIFVRSAPELDAERLKKELAYTDAAAKGMFVNHVGAQRERIWVKWNMEQQLKALNENGKKLALVVPEMFEAPANPEDIDIIPRWVRHDIYCGLINGAKGVVVYSLFPRRGLPFEAYLAPFMKVATELNGEMELGRILLFGEDRGDISADIISGPKEASCNIPGTKPVQKWTASPLSMANLAYKQERYLFACNSAQEAITVQFSGYPTNCRCSDLFAGAGNYTFKGGVLTVELRPLQVVVFVFSKK